MGESRTIRVRHLSLCLCKSGQDCLAMLRGECTVAMTMSFRGPAHPTWIM